MNATRRSTWLRIVMPPLALGLVYVALIGMPKVRELSTVREALAKQQRRDTDNEHALVTKQFASVNARIADLAQKQRHLEIQLKQSEGVDRDKLESIQAAASTVAHESTHSNSVGEESALIVGRLTELMAQHHLTVVNEGPMDKADHIAPPIYLTAPDLTDKTTKHPRTRQSAAAYRLGPVAPEARPWRIEFVGTYTDVVHMLDALDAGDLYTVPIHLVMKPATDSSALRQWTLAIWI